MLSPRRLLPWLGYIAASVVGAVLSDPLNGSAGFSPWYLPAGIGMGVLVIVGPRAAPVVLLARLAGLAVADGDVVRDRPGTVLLQGVVIIAVYTVAAVVLRRIGMRKAHLREFGWLVSIGVVAAPMVAATCVALIEVVEDRLTFSEAVEAARTFWIGDAVTVATIVPFMLVVGHTLAAGPILERLPSSRNARIETAVQVASLVLVPVLVIATANRNTVTPVLVLAVLPVIWVAVRRDLVVAAAGPVVVNLTVGLMASRLRLDEASAIDLQVVMLSAALAADYVGVALRTRSDQEAEAVEQAGRYEALLGGSSDLVVRFDRQGEVIEGGTLVDAAAIEIARHIGASWAQADSPAWDSPRPEQHDWSTGSGTERRHYRTRVGVERSAGGAPLALVSVTTDLTDLRIMQMQIAEAVARDDLTGLANTAALLEFCAQRIAGASADDRLGVVVLDLDRFAQIREAATSEGADELLRRVASLLVEASPPRALVARTGDREFVVAALHRAESAGEDAAALAQRLLEVTHGADRRGRSDLLTASVGVTVAVDGQASARTLLADARLAVGAAKEQGRDQVVVFDREYRRAASDRRSMLDAIRRALDDDEFRVLYQPEVALADGHIVGVEALVRWDRPGRGILPPAEFLELAERNGLIAELGAQVLDRALAQTAIWHAAGSKLVVGVNVSAQQLVSDQFVVTVDDAIRRHGVPAHCLRLELTETSLLLDPTLAVSTLGALRELGAQLALDDFGAGYASIGYLRTLPLDVLKIDQSFVAGLPLIENDVAIVRFVMGMAETLGLEVTAEGIETQAQADALLALGCRYGQGYLYDRPVPASLIEEHLRRAAVGPSTLAPVQRLGEARS